MLLDFGLFPRKSMVLLLFGLTETQMLVLMHMDLWRTVLMSGRFRESIHY